MFITAPLKTREPPETVTLGGNDAEDTPTHALVVQLISGSVIGGGGGRTRTEHAPAKPARAPRIHGCLPLSRSEDKGERFIHHGRIR